MDVPRPDRALTEGLVETGVDFVFQSHEASPSARSGESVETFVGSGGAVDTSVFANFTELSV